MTMIKDPLLKQAIMFIVKIGMRDREAYVDVHEANIMFRLTSTGPQLVISDPLMTRVDDQN